MRVIIALTTACILLATGLRPARAQETPDQSEETIRVETALVNVPVSVTDRDGRYVANLRKEDFSIYEDGIEQEVSFFNPVETPFTVALLIDASPSTVPILDGLVEAANLFMNRMRPDDRFLLVFFDLKVHELVKATSLRDLRPEQIKYTPRCCGTSLYDAVDFVLRKRLERVAGRKAIILFTDGVDTTSRATDQHTLRRAEELDVLIYPIRFDTYVKRDVPDEYRKVWRGVWPEDYARGEAYLQQLAQKTGGRLYSGNRLEDLTRKFVSIAEELGRQYSIGYYPRGAGKEGERRQIKVKVRVPGLVVHAKESYIYNGTAGRRSDKK